MTAQRLRVSVSKEQLVQILANRNRATPCTIIARTVPNLLKKNNPFLPCFKVSKVNGFIYWQYEKSVNRQRLRENKETDFSAEPRRWGQRLPKSPFVAYRDKLYLELKVQKSLGHFYEKQDGSSLNTEEIERFLPQKSEGRQNLDNPVILRDYDISNIQEIHVDGLVYEVVGV